MNSEYFLQCVIHIQVWQQGEIGDHAQNYFMPNVFRLNFLLISPVDEYILTIGLYTCIYYFVKFLINTNIYLTL